MAFSPSGANEFQLRQSARIYQRLETAVPRASRDEVIMTTALLYSLRSTCQRRAVGAVLAYDGRIISTGYAGAPSKMPHCSPKHCDLSKPCTRTVHAEANVIAFAARYGRSTEGAELFCTLSPCQECTKLIINSGIIRVVYLELYRDVKSLETLREAGVLCEKYEVQEVLSLGFFDQCLRLGTRPDER